jgi:hypothetical protein
MWDLVIMELQCAHWQTFTICLAGNFLLHSQTKPVLVKYTVGPFQIKGMGTRQAAVIAAEVCPVKAVHLASLSAFWFPQIAVVFPFWYPQQCMTTTHLEAHTASSNSRISCPYFKVEWGTQTVSYCPKVSLSSSATKTAAAARVHRQGGQLWEAASSCFDT